MDYLSNIKAVFQYHNDPSTDNQLQQGQENQQATSYNRPRIEREVTQMDNPHLSEISKASSHNTGETTSKHSDRRTRKPDTWLEYSPSSSIHVQSRTKADENAIVKTQLETSPPETIKEMEGRIQMLMKEKKELQAENEQLLREKREAEKQIRDLRGETQKLEEELKSTTGTLRGIKEKHLDTEKLLEERTADLKVAQTFLTTDDHFGGADIMNMVEVLNAEIFQGAALIAELLGDKIVIFNADQRKKVIQRPDDSSNPLTQIVGRKLIEHLSTNLEQVQVDPLPLQLAVQAILTDWCVRMVKKIYAGRGSGALHKIYRRIWESEPQAVAGRWRAMTAGHAKHLESTTTTEKDSVIDDLSTLLSLCGNPTTNVARQQIDLCLQQVASTIMNMWMQLRIAIHEGVTFTEMQVFAANSNEKYQDAAMNDIYADTEHVQQSDLGKGSGRILCAVGMGLKRSVISRNRDGMPIPNDTTLLKAKVAFPYVLFHST